MTESAINTEDSTRDTYSSISYSVTANEKYREHNISDSARLVSATAGALITSLVVTPFDVVKTRLQSQFNIKHNNNNHISRATTSSSNTIPLQRTFNLWCDQCHIFTPSSHASNHLAPIGAHCTIELPSHYIQQHTHDNTCNIPSQRTTQHIHNTFNKVKNTPSYITSSVSNQLHFNGSIDAVQKIITNEGILSLWRGLSATLAMSVPSTVIYYSMYDKLKIRFNDYLTTHDHTLINLPTTSTLSNNNNKHNNNRSELQLSSLSPLLAGTTARTMTTAIVSPVELIRTRTQASSKSIPAISMIRQEVSRGGVTSLWRGLYPTLWRDVPFSAVYWTVYEAIKHRLFTHWQKQELKLHQQQHRNTTLRSHIHLHDRYVVTAAFISGATSGMIAATLTHPFDLVKTRRQIDMYANISHNNTNTRVPVSTYQVLRTVVENEGITALWSGWTPRVFKIAPACSIMIASYEFVKSYMSQHLYTNNDSNHNH